MIHYRIGGGQTKLVKMWKFPDTSIGTNIGEGFSSNGIDNITITLIFGDEGFSINDNLFALESVVDALRMRYPMCFMHLRLPYVPYGRQDRICNDGEGHSLRIIGRKINSLGFKTVCVVDPHSTVTEAVIDNCHASSQHNVFAHIGDFSETYIVAPDAGALKKCEEFARLTNAKGVLTCQKRRDMKTGKIIEFKMVDCDHVEPGSNFFVLDDICDKGGTFIAVADAIFKLHPARIDLAVTHGLFTHENGIEPLIDVYDRVYTTDSYIRPRVNQSSDVLEVIKLY